MSVSSQKNPVSMMTLNCCRLSSGIPLMRVKQKEFTWQYMNMTTIAIFFAGLTVAMLQYTFESTTSGIAITVNTLLFLSLVFSIASGALNLLVLAWRHSYVYVPYKSRALPYSNH